MSGFGEWTKADYATASVARDGSCGLVYVPSARTLRVRMSALRAPVSASWFDPTTAVRSAAGESPIENQGERPFTAPGKNGAGDEDWVLVLQAQQSQGE